MTSGTQRPAVSTVAAKIEFLGIRRRKHEVGPISARDNVGRGLFAYSLDSSLPTSMSTTSEYFQFSEIDADEWIYAITFTANGEYLVGGGRDVQVWQVKDGKRVATMPVNWGVYCVAGSKDGKWIAAGSREGQVLVWNATNYRQVFAGKASEYTIWDIDFSPNSSHLVSANGNNCTATIWDTVARRKKVGTLTHDGGWVEAAKYSTQGDRIATATKECVRVWDGNNWRLLVDIKVGVDPWRGLLWFDNHILVKTNDSKIKQIDTSTGSIVPDWLVPDTDLDSCIAMPQHGKFVAYSSGNNISFWSTSTHTQLGLNPQSWRDIRSIDFSPDGQLLAIAAHEEISCLIIESEIITQQIHCETIYTSGRLKEASECLLHMASREVNMTEPVKVWVSSLVERCLSVPENYVDLSGEVTTHNDALVRQEASYVSHTVMQLSREWARLRLATGSWKDALATATSFMLPKFTAYQVICEGLETNDNVVDAVTCFHQMCSEKVQDINDGQATWSHDFRSRCCQKLECLGDSAMNAMKYDDAILQYTAALSLNPATLPDLLVKRGNAYVEKGAWEDSLSDANEWFRLILMMRSWKDALAAAGSFRHPRFSIYQVLCERLEIIDHVVDAVACFHQMCGELVPINKPNLAGSFLQLLPAPIYSWVPRKMQIQRIDDDQSKWIQDFKLRCCEKLEDLGNIAMDGKQYDEAILQYTAALSLNHASPQGLHFKRSKARAGKGEWDDALDDANRVIQLDPSSPSGYERKYAALHGMGRYDAATDAFDTMLSKMSKSSDPKIRERSRRYVRPEQTKKTIRTSIQNAIRDSPLVLIDVNSGRLCSKSEQAAAFESTPAFTTLVVSMTTHIDQGLIEQVIGEFYRYATFSHTWEPNEPLFESVTKVLVYDLQASPTHHKLQMFCKIVREEGINWAWSDTCCIDKRDHFVLQEALVRMFKWYEGSAMTIIFLCDVDRLAELGALIMSLWNSRGWTLQEYHASKVVRIYTKDWTPYLGLTIHNHKESPEIISEMERATGVSARALTALRPGLNDIREKLRLASTRQTTRVEDAAYSLLGIFSMTLPVTYGEGDKALGRLLSQLLTSAGDTSILAWSGMSGSFNSCLPSTITVFDKLPTSHIPPAIADAEMGTNIARLRAPSPDLAQVTMLYDQLNVLPIPCFIGQRLRLPCLTFKIRIVSTLQDGTGYIFHAQAGALGVVDIKTKQDLSELGSLQLIHPWIDFLLDRQPVGKTSPESSARDALPSFSYSNPPDVESLSTVSPTDEQMRALHFMARLRQPFGALLLTPIRRNVEEYRRVATESLVMVQVEEITSATLDGLIHGVRMLDVL